MEALSNLVGAINGYVWGVPMLVSILGVGVFLTVRLDLLPIRTIGYGFRLLLQGRTPDQKDQQAGDITPFSALMTSLSATIGTGNIVGVATAITLGGPGALFWMWMTALVGMATKYAEAVCAVQFREEDEAGNRIGGPMYYIRNGLGAKWGWLAVAFAIFGAIAGFGIGNMVQSNSIADALNDKFHITPLITAVTLMVLVGAVLLGGIKRIGLWASRLVPSMAILYVAIGLLVLLLNITEIPAAIALVVKSAFTGQAATGGFAGAAVWAAIRFGVARGVFSNEAGLGSAPIAHAAAQTNDPVRQGTIAMLGTFIDTLIICTITGLAIVATGSWSSGATGVDLTAMAFGASIPFGQYFVSLATVLFAFTTILGWSYYGEKCWQYLLGRQTVMIYRIIWVLAVAIGPLALLAPSGPKAGIDFVWLISDTLNALMALPNLIALVLLSPVVVQLTRAYYSKKS